MDARRCLPLLLLAACAAAPAAEKTLYKCRAADGSLAFQEEPCQGAPLQVIPISPEATKPIKLTEPGCVAMARDIWYLKGTVENIDTSDASRQRLREREASLRSQCGAELERTQLAIECAVLAGALGVSGGGTEESEAKVLKVRQQHAAQCSDAKVQADIDSHLHAAPPAAPPG
ncbi:MAG TPA: DUF4124 domain-containing protein [Xanthomonadales bacterium]|nr:DUF4124 domain-containing protein [Xanthomonadales bacterium]